MRLWGFGEESSNLSSSFVVVRCSSSFRRSFVRRSSSFRRRFIVVSSSFRRRFVVVSSSFVVVSSSIAVVVDSALHFGRRTLDFGSGDNAKKERRVLDSLCSSTYGMQLKHTTRDRVPNGRLPPVEVRMMPL